MRLVATEYRNYVSGRFPAEIWEITAEEMARPQALIPSPKFLTLPAFCFHLIFAYH